MYKMQLLVCGGTGCRASASATIVEKLNESLKAHQPKVEAQVVSTGFFGFFEKGPIVKVNPATQLLTQGKTED